MPSIKADQVGKAYTAATGNVYERALPIRAASISSSCNTPSATLGMAGHQIPTSSASSIDPHSLPKMGIFSTRQTKLENSLKREEMTRNSMRSIPVYTTNQHSNRVGKKRSYTPPLKANGSFFIKLKRSSKTESGFVIVGSTFHTHKALPKSKIIKIAPGEYRIINTLENVFSREEERGMQWE